jgi:hypothetical protein
MSKFIPFLNYAAVRKFLGQRETLDLGHNHSETPPSVSNDNSELFATPTRSFGRGPHRTAGRAAGSRTSGRGPHVVHTVSAFPYYLRDERTPLSEEELHQLPVAHKFSA